MESLADYLVIYQSLINQGIFRTGESNALTSQRGFSTPTCLLTTFWFPVVVAEAARPADFVILGCREGPTKKTKPPFLLLFPPCLEEEMMCLAKLLVSSGMFRRKLGPPHWKQNWIYLISSLSPRCSSVRTRGCRLFIGNLWCETLDETMPIGLFHPWTTTREQFHAFYE